MDGETFFYLWDAIFALAAQHFVRTVFCTLNGTVELLVVVRQLSKIVRQNVVLLAANLKKF